MISQAEPRTGKLTEAELDARIAEPWPVRRIIPTRRSLWFKAKRLARIVWIKWLISADEEWIKACDPDGALTTRQMTAARHRLQDLRVQLAIEYAS